MTTPVVPPEALMEAWRRYRQARADLLALLHLPLSNRDPLAEFSEQLVAALLGGTLADSRVQKGWDVQAPAWGRVQVKYVANPGETWINGHAIQHTDDMDHFALVIVWDLQLRAILMFRRGCLGPVCQRLKKRHPDQERVLQLTLGNVRDLMENRDEFAQMGVTVLLCEPDGSWTWPARAGP